jgi:glycosyltransferase involved in cell wall biosynthesis
MKKKPLVSVIIPNFNHAAYLKQRIDSVLAQTFSDLEIILLDDASTDNSRSVIEPFRSEPRIAHIIYNETNSGSTFLQWKKGIDLAKGDHIWIAESDDFCEMTFLENVYGACAADPSVTLSYAQSVVIDGSNNVKWISRSPYLEKIMDGKLFIREFLLYGNAVFNASMAVFSRSAYLQLTNEYTSYKFCGDWLFWAQIAKQGNVSISGKVLNYFRKHDGDVSGGAYGSGYNFIEELRLLFSFYDDRYISSAEFYAALEKKYLRYRAAENSFEEKVRTAAEELFYRDKRTHSFASALKRAFRKLRFAERLSRFTKK